MLVPFTGFLGELYVGEFAAVERVALNHILADFVAFSFLDDVGDVDVAFVL